ncbi:autotransporter-associated beta strand repeat-containing protein, partial [Bosea sp. FBZP-16]|uniref:autotransporter-associated beta strand repeat-containing protein n=1 Tax=Bosea sp. FBZP-16 TaxID=2065382 RepID=UPI00131A1A30
EQYGTCAGVRSGSVTKRGSGVVTFTGSSSLTGQTSVEAGSLSVYPQGTRRDAVLKREPPARMRRLNLRRYGANL